MNGAGVPSLRWLAAVCLGTVLSACGGSQQGQAAANPQGDEPASDEAQKKSPEDIEKMFSREADPISKQPVAGGKWTAYLEAKSKPRVEPAENMLIVSADLGWETDFRCYVYERIIDAGAAVNTMVKAASTKVNFKALQAYFFEHDGLVPIVGVRGVYNVEQNGVLLAGDYKLMIMPRMEHPVLCEHDAPGYAKSFARVATDFAKSFKYESQQPTPQRGELWAVTLQGAPVGFTQSLTFRLEGDQVRQATLSARFVPRGPGELLLEDEATVVTADKKGALVNGKYLTYENGEPTMVIDLERHGKGYDYVGTIQDKELRGSFKSKQPLLSEYALLKRLKSLSAAPKKTKFDQWEYTPSVDPAQATQVTYEVTPEKGALVVAASTGQRGMVMRVNERGTMGQVLMPVGATTVQADLIEEVGGL